MLNNFAIGTRVQTTAPVVVSDDGKTWQQIQPTAAIGSVRGVVDSQTVFVVFDDGEPSDVDVEELLAVE